MILNKEIKIAGMQCRGCESGIAETMRQLDGVISAQADQRKGTIDVIFNSCRISLEEIRQECAAKGYPLAAQSSRKESLTSTALSLLALAGIVLTLLLTQKIWFQLQLPMIDSQTGAGMILFVGLLSGIHCVGMCGSFVVGFTAKDAEKGRLIFRSHLTYGVGKTLSYAAFGAIFGLLGSLLRLAPWISGVSLGLAGLFLVLYGLKMLNVFTSLKSLSIKEPAVITKFACKNREGTHNPLLIGIFSGFLFGCGPLQVMYVLAAGNGNPLQGAIILALFGVGTLPALLGFGLLTRLLSNTMNRRILQTSGIILIVMGMMMFNTGLLRAAVDEKIPSVESAPLPCCRK